MPYVSTLVFGASLLFGGSALRCGVIDSIAARSILQMPMSAPLELEGFRDEPVISEAMVARSKAEALFRENECWSTGARRTDFGWEVELSCPKRRARRGFHRSTLLCNRGR